ncbi:MAG: response regulator [Methanotrichaceae archaeon]
MVFNSVEFSCKMDSHSPLSVLLAEDDPANQRVTLIMLKRLGYNADAVNNGLQVLKAFENRTYDLVLMDIVMPKMDGFAATKEIRKRYPASKQPTIIALTAYILPDGRKICIEAGMNDYIAKPVRMSELANALRKHPIPVRDRN